MVVRTHRYAKLTVTRVRNADVNIRVSRIRGCQIGRNGRCSHTVGRNQAPGLASRELPYATLYVNKEEAQTQSVWVGGSKNVGSIVSVEVAFHKPGNVVGSELAGNLQIPA